MASCMRLASPVPSSPSTTPHPSPILNVRPTTQSQQAAQHAQCATGGPACYASEPALALTPPAAPAPAPPGAPVRRCLEDHQPVFYGAKRPVLPSTPHARRAFVQDFLDRMEASSLANSIRSPSAVMGDLPPPAFVLLGTVNAASAMCTTP